MPAAITENGTTSTIPCPSVTETVPNVVGMNTPTGVVRVQEAGLAPVPQNEHSRKVPNGYIIGTSPSAGTRVPARTQVIVFNSLGP
jgi:beta-lactam-binding protein with PASTA domain